MHLSGMFSSHWFTKPPQWFPTFRFGYCVSPLAYSKKMVKLVSPNCLDECLLLPATVLPSAVPLSFPSSDLSSKHGNVPQYYYHISQFISHKPSTPSSLPCHKNLPLRAKSPHPPHVRSIVFIALKIRNPLIVGLSRSSSSLSSQNMSSQITYSARSRRISTSVSKRVIPANKSCTPPLSFRVHSPSLSEYRVNACLFLLTGRAGQRGKTDTNKEKKGGKLPAMFF